MANLESESLPENIPEVAVQDEEAPDVGLSSEAISNDSNSFEDEEECDDLPVDDPRPSRVYYDGDGWKGSDYFNHYESDTPDDSFPEGWREVNSRMQEIQVGGSRLRQWEIGKKEVQQILDRCRKVMSKPVLSRQDFVKYFYGENSPLFRIMHDELGWSHKDFLQFVMTSARLSANNWTASKLYDADHPQQHVDRLMEEESFLKCWRDCEDTGLMSTREDAANAPRPLWAKGQNEFNEMSKSLVVTGRRGRQTYTVDDDKIHCEVNPSKHQDSTLKFIKHHADNRIGLVLDTLVTTAAFLIVTIQIQIKGLKQQDALKNQLYTTFGSNALTPPNLQNIEFHGDRGYFSEQAFLCILLLCGCMFTCTCPQGNWLPFAIGKPDLVLRDGDTRTIIQPQGAMTHEIREKTFEAGGNAITVACQAYRTGTGKVVLLCSSQHRKHQFDFVPLNDTYTRLWHKDRDALKKRGFLMDCSAAAGLERTFSHDDYYTQFQDLPIVQLTVSQGHPEWHIVRPFSCTSTSSHALIKALLRHGLDLEHDYIRKVLEFMCQKYNYEDRVQEQTRREQEEEAAEQEADEEAMQAPELYNDDYLREHGVPELVEQSERTPLEARLSLLEYNDEFTPKEEFIDNIKIAEDEFLFEFLKAAGMNPQKIPKGTQPKIDRCIKWADAAKEQRPYVLLTISELKTVYREKKNRAPRSIWKAPDLITEILREDDGNDTSTRPTVSAQDPSSVEQELMNIVVRSISLKPLEGEAKQHCDKGHLMESVYSKELIEEHNDSFPWGKIDEICSVGIVQKIDKPHVKASVDRLICVTDAENRSQLFLTEYKARIKPLQAQKERDRVEDLRANALMEEDSIFCESSSTDPNRFLYIASEEELLQALHHAYTYEKTSVLHTVGNAKSLLSCTKFEFDPDLLDAYAKLLDFIYRKCLKPFYAADDEHVDLKDSDEVMARVEHAVKVNKDRIVDMKTLQHQYKLMRVASKPSNQPLPPCKYVRPTAYSWWNVMKPGSDQATQMLWENNFVSPRPHPNCALIKRFFLMLPFYQIQRLSQMATCSRPLDEFYSCQAFRKYIAQGKPMWYTIRCIEDDLHALVLRSGPPPVVRPVDVAAIAQAGRIIIDNPMGVAAIQAVVQNIAAPESGRTPKQKPDEWYGRSANANAFVTERRHNCTGVLVRAVDAKTRIDRVTRESSLILVDATHVCAHCLRPGAHLWCTVCHHWLHADPKKLPSADQQLLAIPTGKRNADGTPVFMYAYRPSGPQSV